MSRVNDFIIVGAAPRFVRDGNSLIIGAGRQYTRLTDVRDRPTADGAPLGAAYREAVASFRHTESKSGEESPPGDDKTSQR